MDEVRSHLIATIKMELTIEVHGRARGFLKSDVYWHDGRPRIFIETPLFAGKPSDTVLPAPKRSLGKHGPNARAMLGSLVPNLAKKCAHYHSQHAPFAYAPNVCNKVKLLLAKGYLVDWWRPQLVKTASA